MLKRYFQFHQDAEKKYPTVASEKKLVTLMEVGSFYEMYRVVDPKVRGPDLPQVCQLLNILCTRKDKQAARTNPKVDCSNPMMAGFTSGTLSKYLKVLLANNYTVVQVDQVTEPPSPKRDVVCIHSPSTSSFETAQGNPEMVTLMLERLPCGKVVTAGCCMDLSTGKTRVIEVQHQDQILTWLRGTTPREAILVSNDAKLLDRFSKHQMLKGIPVHQHDMGSMTDTASINYIQQTLRTHYPVMGPVSPLETFGLDRWMLASQGLTICLDFIQQHDPSLLVRLPYPDIDFPDQHCTMDRNALVDLKVTASPGMISLLSILDKCMTSMGRRELRERLTRPSRDLVTIEARLDAVEATLPCCDGIRKMLAGMLDLARLHRVWARGKILPSGWYQIVTCYKQLVGLIEGIDTDVLARFPGSKQVLQVIGQVIDRSSKTFYHDSMRSLTSLHDMKDSFIKEGIDEDHDSIRSSLAGYDKELQCLQDNLETSLGHRVTLKWSDRDGYRFVTTVKRAEKLQQGWNLYKQGKQAKIWNQDMVRISAQQAGETKRLQAIVKSIYMDKTIEIFSQLGDGLAQVVEWVAGLDCAQSSAWMADKHAYTRPKPVAAEKGFLEARSIRHPIVEIVQSTEPYVPNDVLIGENPNNDSKTGVLLFAPNAAGKSTLMCSVGLTCCMAQAGMFVPASSFTWTPFDSIFTRINANDSIGVSSFMAEMLQLRNIVHRATSRSLVLSDEACNMTEHVSGISISAAILIRMVNRSIPFIFATHLHQLLDLDPVLAIQDRVSFKHLTVEMCGQELIYRRKLQDGAGEKVYGLKVARHVLQDPDFHSMAETIQKLLLTNAIAKEKNIVQTVPRYRVKSNYNTAVSWDRCQICGSKVEDTHHIIHQADADNKNIVRTRDVGPSHKNKAHNLVGLCKACHDSVHHGDLSISGWVQTTQGIRLKHTKKRFSDQEKQYVKEKDDTVTGICNSFLQKFGKSISPTHVRRLKG